jgi:hypothetical protein
MRHLRLLIIALATIFVLALAAFALITRPPTASDDDIIIKGGSLEIECGKNHGNDCLGGNEGKVKYKHKQETKHITRVVVKNLASNSNTPLFDNSFDAAHQPEIQITYK